MAILNGGAAAAPAGAPAINGISWPERPRLNEAEYPVCQQDYARQTDRFVMLDSASRCRQRLESFNRTTLNGFASDVRDYGLKLLKNDLTIRGKSLSLGIKISARDYVAGELAAFRSKDDTQPGGRAYRTYYRLVEAYRYDVAQLTRVIDHLSPGQE